MFLQMQAVLNAKAFCKRVTRARIINGILPSSSGLPVLGKYHSEAGEMQKTQH